MGDLLIGHRVHLTKQQRRSLCLGKLADVGQQLAELLTILDPLVGRGRLDDRMGVHRVPALGDRLAQMVEGAVAGDPVEPGPQLDLALVGEDRAVGVYEHLLEDVLGVLGGAEHLAAEAEQSRLVAVDDHLEGVIVAAAKHRHQTLVSLQS